MVARVSDERFNNPIFKIYGEPGHSRSVLNEVCSCLSVSGIEELNEADIIEAHDAIWQYHTHTIHPHQCTSVLLQRIQAPVHVVWSIVRRFDAPQLYKRFVRSCVMTGDGKVGSMRHYTVVSGLPAASSTERLEVLDDEKHVLSFKIVGGEHRLRNYRSITTVHQDQAEGNIGTFVVESYVVDIPEGNTMEETCIFANTLVRCNLQSLAKLAEERASLNANVSPAASAKLLKNTIM